ncbi:MAG TPA: hypothetical protein PLD10_07965 [Rhodopila sp.]|nr:hypothetical protein [Rhodopila sp.]
MGRASYQDLLASADQAQAGVDTTTSQIRASATGLAANAGLHAVLVDESAEVLVNTSALSAAYRMQTPMHPKPSGAPPLMQISCSASEFDAVSSMARQVTHYQDQILRLKANSATVVEQRDQWKRRAQEAEARMAHGDSTVPSEADSNYVALKRRLARMLHPDSASGSADSKSARTAIFVEIWSAIDQIEKRTEGSC